MPLTDTGLARTPAQKAAARKAADAEYAERFAADRAASAIDPRQIEQRQHLARIRLSAIDERIAALVHLRKSTITSAGTDLAPGDVRNIDELLTS